MPSLPVSYMRYPVFAPTSSAESLVVKMLALLFGRVLFVHMNFQLIILAIVFVSSLLPTGLGGGSHRARRNAPQSDPRPVITRVS